MSVSTTGGCTVTTATTADVAALLRVIRLMWAGPNPLLGQEETVYATTEQRPLTMMLPVATVPMARPMTSVSDAVMHNEMVPRQHKISL